MIKLDMPILDVYSWDGRSIYHGDDSHKNAAFLKQFSVKPESARSDAASGMKLADWMEMFPQFGGSQAKAEAGQYTIFAVTYPSWDVCQEQNQAVELYRKFAGKSHARVWEVRLQR